MEDDVLREIRRREKSRVKSDEEILEILINERKV